VQIQSKEQKKQKQQQKGWTTKVPPPPTNRPSHRPRKISPAEKNYQSCVCCASSGAAYWHAKTPGLNLIPPPFPDRSPATKSNTNSQNCRHRKKPEKRQQSQSECDDGKQQSQKNKLVYRTRYPRSRKKQAGQRSSRESSCAVKMTKRRETKKTKTHTHTINKVARGAVANETGRRRRMPSNFLPPYRTSQQVCSRLLVRAPGAQPGPIPAGPCGTGCTKTCPPLLPETVTMQRREV